MPSYNLSTSSATALENFDPAGAALIVLEGVFSGHHTIRAAIDRLVFVECSDDLLHERFASFYHWKSMLPKNIIQMLQIRAIDEWPQIDLQRKGADIILNFEGRVS